MRDPRVATIVADAIRHFRGQRYRLLAWCDMPNHVYVLFSPQRGHELETIRHSWKSYSANKANRFSRAAAPSGSANISIILFEMNLRFAKSRSTFKTTLKEPVC